MIPKTVTDPRAVGVLRGHGAFVAELLKAEGFVMHARYLLHTNFSGGGVDQTIETMSELDRTRLALAQLRNNTEQVTRGNHDAYLLMQDTLLIAIGESFLYCIGKKSNHFSQYIPKHQQPHETRMLEDMDMDTITLVAHILTTVPELFPGPLPITTVGAHHLHFLAEVYPELREQVDAWKAQQSAETSHTERKWTELLATP